MTAKQHLISGEPVFVLEEGSLWIPVGGSDQFAQVFIDTDEEVVYRLEISLDASELDVEFNTELGKWFTTYYGKVYSAEKFTFLYDLLFG